MLAYPALLSWRGRTGCHTSVSPRGTEGSESISLQRRVRLSPGAAFEGREPGLPARLFANHINHFAIKKIKLGFDALLGALQERVLVVERDSH